MRTLGILLCNNMRLELRSRDVLFVLISLCLLLSAVVAFGLGSAFLDPETRTKLFPALLWVVVVLAATVAVGRGFEYDVENGALDRVILCGASAWKIFLAHAVCSFVILCLAFVCAVLGLMALMSVQLFSLVPAIIVCGLPVLSAFALLSTLLSAVTVRAKLRQVLLPLIILPLIFPLLAGAIEITTFAGGLGSDSAPLPWINLVLGLNLLYLLLGAALFKFVITE